MPNPEFTSFLNLIGSMLSLRSGRKAVALRKTLGASLDRRLSKFPKGVVQEKKSRFVLYAKTIAGVDWLPKEPHKIITTLKNTGDGDESMVCALYFLCCKTDEFGDLRETLFNALGSRRGEDKEGLPLTIEYRFRSLIGGSWRETRDQLSRQVAARQAEHQEKERKERTEAELKLGFRYLIDHDLDYAINTDDTDAAIDAVLLRARTARQDIYSSPSDFDSDEDKIVGRAFVENDAAKFIQLNSSPACGTLSIIDIDDQTKINKIHGHDQGDNVLLIVGMLVDEAVKDLKYRSGRCGDDTFFVALAAQDETTTLPIMERLRERVKNYAWHEESPGLRVSVSIGIAGFRPLEYSIDMAVRAGFGMRNAKQMGGNVVTRGPRHLPHSGLLSSVSTLSVWS